jgi:WD40 repeat protein/tRNA A-37 threonylcarbamoyl transferase component Bud32
MSDVTPSLPSADRNLLFGLLALQLEFIRHDALVDGMKAWVLNKARPLGLILVEQQALRPDQCAALDVLVAVQLEGHQNDPHKSLAAIGVPAPLRDELRSLPDSELQASLAHVPSELPSTVACTPSMVADMAPADGAVGPRYQVLRPHARGGLGEVFVALDQELHREVALKEIDAKHADDPHSRGRFVREAEITGGLEHPGVVPVYGLGRHADGRPFYAMRSIRGETLRDAIARFHAAPGHSLSHSDLAFRQLLGRFVAVCNAVAYAHSRGVIHRDLKPSNIMLGEYGETLVVDWGLAKVVGRDVVEDGDGPAEPVLVPVLGEGSSGTRTGAALGTPAYMSPEQAAGRVDQLGPVSDVYSLGATLYCLLTGRPPVEGEDVAELLARAQRGDWQPPRHVEPAVPPALDAVCRNALAREPDGRYASALELAGDVERWLAGEPVSAWREPWAVRGRRWLAKHRTLVTAAAAVIVVALLGSTLGMVLLATAAENEAQARKKAEDKEKEASTRGEELRRTLYIAQMNMVQREYEATNLPRVRELLETHPSWPADAQALRGFEWYYWDRLAHRELLTLQGLTFWSTSVAFSPDGRRIASGENGTVRVWDAGTGQEKLALKGHSNVVHAVAFSPDGRRIASAGQDQSVRLWDAAGGQEIRIFKGHTSWVNAVAFSPDGTRLASGSRDNTVRIWDAGTGQKIHILRGHTGPVMGVAFSPDGRRLASGSVDGTIKGWDAAGGQETLTFQGSRDAVTGVAFCPDGRRLAASSADHTVRVWEVGSGEETMTLEGHGDVVTGIAFSPDGRRLASSGGDGTVRVWDAASGQETHNFKGHGNWVTSVAFSPDGRRLASGGHDNTVKVWDVTGGPEVLTLRGHTGGVWGMIDGGKPMLVPVDGTSNGGGGRVWGVAFSPDGRRLASAGLDHTVRVWDAGSGRELVTIKGHTLPVICVAFSPDGRRLASGGNDNTVRVWDAASGQQILMLRGHTSPVNGIAFSPDGGRIASGSGDRTVRVWDAAGGQDPLVLTGHNDVVSSVSFSPDGRRIASGGRDSAVKLWDAASGRETLTFTGPTDAIMGVAFSPDGGRLASASMDATGRVWDTADGREILTLKGHTGGITGVTFSPDGRRLATGGQDNTVRVWDAASGQETLALKGHTAAVSSVVFSPDGTRIASGSDDDTVKVWESRTVSPEDLGRREIVSLVRELFDRLALRSEVLLHLRTDPMLDAATRAAAVQVADSVPEDPEQLKNAAWLVIRGRAGDHGAYALAVRQAEAAVQTAPGNGRYLTTLGAAEYRGGDYAKALETLGRSEQLNAPAASTHAANLAFLAMAHQQLGQGEQAQALLAQLRDLMKRSRWGQDAEAQAFLREAEQLIGGKPADDRK